MVEVIIHTIDIYFTIVLISLILKVVALIQCGCQVLALVRQYNLREATQ